MKLCLTDNTILKQISRNLQDYKNKMTTMTTEQFFDQMATALGMGGDRPDDVGYIAILEEVKKLKEDLDATTIHSHRHLYLIRK